MEAQRIIHVLVPLRSLMRGFRTDSVEGRCMMHVRGWKMEIVFVEAAKRNAGLKLGLRRCAQAPQASKSS